MNELERHFLKRTLTHILRVKRNVLALVETDFPVDHVALMQQNAHHDRTKFEEPEKSTYMEITEMYRCRRLGLPFEETDEFKARMVKATLHHVTHNPHHPEFFAPQAFLNPNDRDAPPEEMVDGTRMSDIGLVEMCCDWVAMSQELAGSDSACGWADANINVRWKFTDEQVARIYATLDALENALDLRRKATS
jgi:hypothetical protein